MSAWVNCDQFWPWRRWPSCGGGGDWTKISFSRSKSCSANSGYNYFLRAIKLLTHLYVLIYSSMFSLLSSSKLPPAHHFTWTCSPLTLNEWRRRKRGSIKVPALARSSVKSDRVNLVLGLLWENSWKRKQVTRE